MLQFQILSLNFWQEFQHYVCFSDIIGKEYFLYLESKSDLIWTECKDLVSRGIWIM
jgi:hypothetical protein